MGHIFVPLLPTWETWVHLLVPACPNSDDGRNLGNEPADKDTFFLSLPLSLSIFLPPSLSLLPFPQLTLLLLFQINKILIKKDSVPSVKKLMIVYKGFFVGANGCFLEAIKKICTCSPGIGHILCWWWKEHQDFLNLFFLFSAFFLGCDILFGFFLYSLRFFSIYFFMESNKGNDK